MPISPAAQKFHLLILRSALDNSVAVASSSMPALMLGKRHIADMNQNTAEPHAVAIIAISMYDLITATQATCFDFSRPSFFHPPGVNQTQQRATS
jgi:hypothetical protein